MPLKNDDKHKQYFIAFIPPSPVYEDVVNLKAYFRDRYNTKAALKSPPHITLHMPFWWKEKNEYELVQKLQQFALEHEPLKIRLDNFSSFPPRVVFINILADENLIHFQKSMRQFCKQALNLFNANYKEHPYHPHLTLAFRDLKKSTFKEAWEEFMVKTYRAEFVADKFSLLRHDGRQWDVLKDFNLDALVA